MIAAHEFLLADWSDLIYPIAILIMAILSGIGKKVKDEVQEEKNKKKPIIPPPKAAKPKSRPKIPDRTTTSTPAGRSQRAQPPGGPKRPAGPPRARAAPPRAQPAPAAPRPVTREYQKRTRREPRRERGETRRQTPRETQAPEPIARHLERKKRKARQRGLEEFKPKNLRQAVVFSEIVQPPLALREDRLAQWL